MATRMQQRRGTAAQWISTNGGAGPVLNAGEIGWESDTNKFKIGDGTNNWSSLDYFFDANSTLNPAFGSSITFEGSTANEFETILQVTDPTADRTITLPNSSGTIALTTDIAAGAVTETGTQTLTNKTLTSPVINTPTGITKTDVGLANVDNVSDASKPVSTATQTALDLKANLSGATFTGAVSGTSLTLSGDLTINGTTTNINSTNLVVEDKNIVLGDTTEPTDTTADGGGITLKGTTDHTFNWVNATDSWTSSEHLDLASGKEYKINNISLKDVTETLANKSISLGSNTITSTLAQLNTAISDADLASLAGTETLTNKTLSSAVLSGTLTAGGSVGTAGQVLTSTGSGVQYSTPSGGAAFSEFMLIGA